MNLATGTLDRGGQAECQLQRIQVPAFRIEQACLIALTGDPLRQLRTGDELQPVVAPFVAGLMLPLSEQLDPPRHHRRPQMTRPIITLESMPCR
ncbi:hypothetical protein D3C86_1723140 [compost metagenome]